MVQHSKLASHAPKVVTLTKLKRLQTSPALHTLVLTTTKLILLTTTYPPN